MPKSVKKTGRAGTAEQLRDLGGGGGGEGGGASLVTRYCWGGTKLFIIKKLLGGARDLPPPPSPTSFLPAPQSLAGLFKARIVLNPGLNPSVIKS